ncbi:MAG TPA: polymorphic toxin-type HINT domain-containing protein [Pirellulales bacterium]|jgi:HEAT repeat protein
MRSYNSTWRVFALLLVTSSLASSFCVACASAGERSERSDSLANSVADYARQNLAARKTSSVTRGSDYDVGAPIVGTAEQLVERALAAEASGDVRLRGKLLSQALSVDPDYAPAHWQLGDLRVGDEWVSIERASANVAQDGKAAEYRKRRDQTGENASDQYRLAKWCRLVGLTDQERAHLLFTLQLDRGHIDAAQRMKQLRRLAEPAARSEQDLARQEAKEAAAALRAWRPRLISLRRDAESRDPARREQRLSELAAIKDVSALPAIESVFANADGELGSAVVACLANIGEQAATDSLIRYSVSAENEEVRHDAASALADRSMFSYVPTMMAILVPPTKIEFTRAYDVNGQLGYRLSLYQVGPVADVAFTANTNSQDFLTVNRSSGRAAVSIDGRGMQERIAESFALAEEVAANNVERQARNEKIAATLRVATGKKLDDSAESWWNWWLDHNEIYRLPEKPVVSTISLARVATAECFAPGTTVWTLSGPMPIERVKVGESVLSQKPSTGELAYKMVLATTLRPPSPLVVIRAGNETIRATRGHPFWVSGIGWQMAKELQPGQMLHTAHGPVEVESVEQQGLEPGHNLLVDGFNTYFVTDRLFLVHDNLIREVSPATVPGMTVAPGTLAP